MNLFESLQPIESMLDYHLRRHSLLASNLANAETPGYHPQDLKFRDTLESHAAQLRQTEAGHVQAGGLAAYDLVEGEPYNPRMDKNGVQLERTMAQLSANRIRYEASVELARRRLGLLRYAATDGGAA